MKLTVIDAMGISAAKKINLSAAIFDKELVEHNIYLAIKQYYANQRQGTHKVKGRSEIKGSTRKLFRQKGTGNARAGSIKSPIFRGGGVVHGPQPRSYHFKLNKKVKANARKIALTSKYQDKKIIVFDDLNINEPKTKLLIEALKQRKITLTKKHLIVLHQPNLNIFLASRNIPMLQVVSVETLNTFQILQSEFIIFTLKSLEMLSSTK